MKSTCYIGGQGEKRLILHLQGKKKQNMEAFDID